MDSVTSGKLPSNRNIKLAVSRFSRDLKSCNKKNYPFYFDEDAADRAITFVKRLRHTKGEFANRQFDLQQYQAFILANIFGWKKKDNNKRRFTKVYTEIARKNGKSEFAAAIGIYLLYADNEQGAEIYTAATKKDQAKIVFNIIKSMVKKMKLESPKAKKTIGVHTNNIHVLSTESLVEPLPADSDKLDGLNPHGAIIDEYHSHKSSDLLEVIETGMGARLQPLLFIITTAGFNRYSPCFRLRKVCIDVLEDHKVDDTLFSMIFTLDEGDDWKQETSWIKSNPNLGNAPYLSYMQSQLTKAINEGADKEIQFKTKNLNIWTSTGSTWISADKWSANGQSFDIKKLKGRRAYGGLDLSSVSDLSAFVLVFPPIDKDPTTYIVGRYYCPEEGAKKRSAKDGVPYLQWAKDKAIKMTPGNVIDYDYIKKDILDAAEDYDIIVVEFDRYNSSQIVIDLTEEGIAMDAFSQTYVHMNAPINQIEKMILNNEANHGGDVALAWMAGNVMIKLDANGNRKFDKAASTEKIDGMVALAMAVGGWMTEEVIGPSVYESKGITKL